MDYDDDDGDVVHIPIPRELLLRLVSRHPNIPSIKPFSTDANWACVGLTNSTKSGSTHYALMKNYHCTPHTYPPLPPVAGPNWSSPRRVGSLAPQTNQVGSAASKTKRPQAPATQKEKGKAANTKGEKPYVYVPSRFFSDQLTAFEVWIARGGSALTKRGPLSQPMQNGVDGSPGSQPNGDIHDKATEDHHLVPRKPPDQLLIVLQVQPHRLGRNR
jgi:regulatory associated protein of mTOR